jgi:hypothetical protein
MRQLKAAMDARRKKMRRGARDESDAERDMRERGATDRRRRAMAMDEKLSQTPSARDYFAKTFPHAATIRVMGGPRGI